ncbi:MAG: LysR family transcriptional regulator [Rhizobiales bacterium]|nr:LysR family transcriptional regulator [Hyphomicrobiales bacterium]
MKNKSAHVFYSPALRYFVEVARVGSIRGAARGLNVVSSAVNRQILNLEDHFGLQLFDRIGRGIKLSEAGEILLVHAKRALADFESALDALDDLSGLKRGIVKIAVVESVAESLMAPVISRFQQTYPGIQIELQVSSSTRVMEAITAAEVHVGMGFNVPHHDELDFVNCQELKIGAVVSPKHPIAKQKSCTLAQCVLYPMVMPNENLSIGQILTNAFKELDLQPKTLVKANSLKFMKSLAAEGKYIGFQTRLGMQIERRSGALVFIPISSPELPSDQLVLVTNKMYDLSLAPRTFIAHLDQALDHFREFEN